MGVARPGNAQVLDTRSHEGLRNEVTMAGGARFRDLLAVHARRVSRDSPVGNTPSERQVIPFVP
jgi:hypothetical protein